MHIAFVKHSKLLSRPQYPGDLTLVREKMSLLGIHHEDVPWDKKDVDWYKYSHIVLTSLVHYHEHTNEFLKWISYMEKQSCSPKILNPLQVVCWNVNKKYLQELEKEGVKIPATVWLDHNIDFANIPQILDNGFKKYNKVIEEVVVKNSVSAGGISVWKCKLHEREDGSRTMSESDLRRLYEQAQTSDGRHGVLVQEFLPEILKEGEWSLMYFDKVFSHAVIKKPNSNKQIGSGTSNTEFRVQTAYGGHFESVAREQVPQKLIDFGIDVLSKVPHILVHARIDIVVRENGEPCLMELEILDPLLFFTESSQAEKYLQAIINAFQRVHSEVSDT